MAVKDLPGKGNLIDRVEARFPGTAQWFRHPIWKALSDQSMQKELIIKGLKELEPAVRRWVLTNRHPDGTRRSSRMPTFPEETQRRLIRRGSFDVLGAAVLMVRYSEVIGHPDLRHPALNVYYALQPTLSRHRYLQHFYPRLFSLVDFYCRRWIFLEKDPAQRLEAIITWQGLQESVWNVPQSEYNPSDQPPSGV